MSEPPIIPGPPDQPDFSLSSVMPASKPSRRSWVLPVVVFIAVVVVGPAGLGAVLWTRSNAAAVATSASPKQTALRVAYLACGSIGEISDADTTLFLDMAGKKPNTGTLDSAQIQCVLDNLKAPTFVTTEMGQTRALDGRQSDKWGDFTASWTYHPDNGLDVLIRQVSG